MKLSGFVLAASVAAAFVTLAQAQAVSPRITAVRFWSLGDVTRIAVEIDGEAQYHAERIASPDRLFLDLSGVERPTGTRGVQAIEVGDRLVRQIRVAVVQPGTTRVVLDLTGTHDYSISQLTNPDRIIVEVRLANGVPAVPPLRSVPGGHSMAVPETASSPKAEPPAANPEPAPPRLPSAMPVDRPAVAAKPERATPPAVPVVAASSAPREAGPSREAPRVAPAKEKPEARVAFDSAAAAKPDSHGDRSLTRTLGLKLERVVLDPGHGGHDTGTIGPQGLMEKDLVLDVAKRLGVLIAKRLGSEVVYTRSDDTFIPLEDRTRIANERKADLFLSIHANSSPSDRIAGSETFYLNFTTSEDALQVATRENATSQTSIHELQTLVQKITLNEKVQESRELASAVQNGLYTGIPRNRSLKNRGIKKAPFVVLIGAQMPSVLAEIAFLSNPRDESMLKRPEYRQRIAEALFKGVSQYASALSHFQVARQRPSGVPAQ
jgi:N-acetylmuramoyl-L-alanine amidase